jgi:hypothetical protein
VNPCTALWTTLSGFESLPPSHFLALLVVAARQRVLWSCRGAQAARRAKTESLPPSQPSPGARFGLATVAPRCEGGSWLRLAGRVSRASSKVVHRSAQREGGRPPDCPEPIAPMLYLGAIAP